MAEVIIGEFHHIYGCDINFHISGKATQKFTKTN